MNKAMTLILACAVFLNSAAASLSPSQPSATFKVYSDLVLLDVVATDKNGRPIRHLTKKDFHVFEDGVEQEISVFRFEDVSSFETQLQKGSEKTESGQTSSFSAPPQTGAPSSSSTRTAFKEEVPYTHRRLIVMMFDLNTLELQDALFARQAAEEYIRTKISPVDLVAVVAMSATLRVVQDFTNDRKLLEAALGKVKLGAGSEKAPLATTDATTGDATGTAEDTNPDTSDPFTPDETQFNIFNTDRKLGAIESVAKLLRDLPEKKSLIHFSSGIQTTGIENQSQLKATIDAANRANLSIYAVDARGLVATPPGGEASKGGAAGTALFSGASMRSGMNNIAAAQETLSTLSEDTGGRAFLDTNNLGEVFTQVQADTQSYYLLGYYSTNLKRDGRFRRIKVTADAAEVKLRFRPGYFAPKEFGQFTPEERERQLEEAVTADAPFTDVPFILSAYSFQADDPKNPKERQMFVPVSLKLPVSHIPFSDRKSRKEATFDFVGQVRDPARHNTVVSYVRDAIRLKLDETTFSKISKGGSLQYDTGFYLRPGSYQVKFLIREDQTGRMGSFEQPLSVPDLSVQRLKMSSVVLSSQLESPEKQSMVERKNDRDSLLQQQEKISNPLIQGDKKIVPNVGHVFSPQQTLYTFFQVYQPGTDSTSHKPHVDLALLFFKNGKKIYETPEYEVDHFDSAVPGTVNCNFSLPLTPFTRGHYTLQLVVLDRVTGARVIQRLPLIIQ